MEKYVQKNIAAAVTDLIRLQQFVDVAFDDFYFLRVVEGGRLSVFDVLAPNPVEHDWAIWVLDPVEAPEEVLGASVGASHQPAVVEFLGGDFQDGLV